MNLKKIFLLLVLVINIYANEINFDELVKQSNKQNKQIMVFFHMEHCPWCHKMIDISLSDKKVMQTINKYFNYVDLDVETNGDVIYNNEVLSKHEFAREFNIYFYPTTLMFDDGEIVQNIKGYRNKQKFTNIIRYVGSKSYNTMNLKEFIIDLEFQE